MESNKHSKDSLIECLSVKRYGLFLTDIEKFDTPIACKGELGIWYFDLISGLKARKMNLKSI